jgi:hypothetical protein
VHQCGNYSLLTGWVVVVGPRVKVEIGMVRFTVHSMVHRTIGSPIIIYVKEEEVALTFGLHGELNALVDTVQVVQEILQLVGFMLSDDEGVIHISKSAEVLVGGQVKRPLLEFLHVKFGNDWRHC